MKIVAIGASAGGIEAISAMLSTLPVDTGASFVVLQHLSPHVKSIMHELLERHTRMTVQVVDKDLRPRPNRIYLIPHDKNLGFRMGKLRILPREPDNKLNLPIDLFMGKLGEAIKH